MRCRPRPQPGAQRRPHPHPGRNGYALGNGGPVIVRLGGIYCPKLIRQGIHRLSQLTPHLIGQLLHTYKSIHRLAWRKLRTASTGQPRRYHLHAFWFQWLPRTVASTSVSVPMETPPQHEPFWHRHRTLPLQVSWPPLPPYRTRQDCCMVVGTCQLASTPNLQATSTPRHVALFPLAVALSFGVLATDTQYSCSSARDGRAAPHRLHTQAMPQGKCHHCQIKQPELSSTQIGSRG